MYLSEDELIEATGCTQPAAQERWFTKRGLNVHRSRTNKLRVSREAYVRWQLGEKLAKAPREPMLRLKAA